MKETSKLHLPLLTQGQLNKDVTHNEALILIDAVLNACLVSLTPINAPSEDLREGELVLIGSVPESSFSGFPHHLAFYTNGWRFIKPKEGFMTWVKDIKRLACFDGEKFLML